MLGQIAAQKNNPINIGDDTYSAASCFTKSLRVFEADGMEKEYTRTVQVREKYKRDTSALHE